MAQNSAKQGSWVYGAAQQKSAPFAAPFAATTLKKRFKAASVLMSVLTRALFAAFLARFVASFAVNAGVMEDFAPRLTANFVGFMIFFARRKADFAPAFVRIKNRIKNHMANPWAGLIGFVALIFGAAGVEFWLKPRFKFWPKP